MVSKSDKRSRYDELHDRYHEILTTRKGTRYEILAAVVFAALERDAVVIHDVEVVGTITGVPHQIDVQIEKDGLLRRILIECKDYDVRGEPVGLGVVRDFFGVVSDVRPDESWIVTCNDFTAPARKYAKGMGIKLATLRFFAGADWENRVHTVISTINYIVIEVDKTNLQINMADELAVKVKAELANHQFGVDMDDDPSQVFDGQAIRSLATIIRGLGTVPVGDFDTEAAEGKLTPDGWISVTGKARYPINGFRISAPLRRTVVKVRMSADQGAARLLLSSLDGLDFVVWDNLLRAYNIDEDGVVTIADEAMQKAVTSRMSFVPSSTLP